MTDQANDGRSGFRQPNSSGNAQKTMTDLLSLPDTERTLMNWLVRQRQASLTDILAYVGGDSETTQAMLEQLIQTGFLVASDASEGVVFKPNLVSRKTRTLPNQVWDALG